MHPKGSLTRASNRESRKKQLLKAANPLIPLGKGDNRCQITGFDPCGSYKSQNRRDLAELGWSASSWTYGTHPGGSFQNSLDAAKAYFRAYLVDSKGMRARF